MSKKKDPICVDLKVVRHSKSEEADAEKPAIYKVTLKGMSKETGSELHATLIIVSHEETIQEDMPLNSMRTVKLVDEQTTLE